MDWDANFSQVWPEMEMEMTCFGEEIFYLIMYEASWKLNKIEVNAWPRFEMKSGLTFMTKYLQALYGSWGVFIHQDYVGA